MGKIKVFSVTCFILLIGSVTTSDISSITSNSTSFCYQIKSNGDNLRYCNVTTGWSQRLSNSSLTTITALLSTIGFVASFYIMYKVAPIVNSNFMSVVKIRSCDICCYPCYVVLPVFKMLWDALDIMLDAYIFHQLEKGKLIDHFIYRNVHVLNGILCFTIFGVLKMFFNMWLLLKASTYFQINQKEDLSNIKRATILTTFLFEDAVELFLVYFWIEKYFTYSVPWYVVAKDCIVAFIAVLMITMDILDARKKENSKHQRILYGVLALLGITQLFRVFGVINQCVNLTLHQECFAVNNGRIVQTPFDMNCLKHLDYIILVLLLFAVTASFYVFLIPTKLLIRKGSSEENEKAVKTNEDGTKDYDSISPAV